MAGGMATRAKGPKEKPWSHPDRKWEVRDAMHTILRAGDHMKDEGLMKEVRKHAKHHADEKAAESHRAQQLAKAGRISPKQLAKLEKKQPLAKGNNGDGGRPSAGTTNGAD